MFVSGQMAAKKTSKATKKAKAPPRPTKAAKKTTPRKRLKASVPKQEKPVRRKKTDEPDFSVFAAESITETQRKLCLACVMDVFTRLLKLAPRTAYSEIRNYNPSVDELTAPSVRPYFESQERCPYCDSPSKWHATLQIHRIEGGKPTDLARRKLVATIGDSEKFVILEQKATQKEAFFEWLDHASADLNFEDDRWLRDISLHYLARKEPKTDWPGLFQNIHDIRRSRRIEEGWETGGWCLYLNPMLFDELLVVQYLVSRSQKAGGLTLEGRYTFAEILARLRRGGYLRHAGATGEDAGDLFDHLVSRLGGGESPVRFYYVVDRREFLQRARSVQSLPKWKARRPAAV
jgi:hypothetical protein